MTGKVNCTCGWSWNKSDSSNKDMYICHECGRDNSNNMKNGGWLDNYGTQANYNDSKATASPDMRGDGFSNVGRKFSPAWGGQFQEGGEIPNAQKGKKVKYVESKNDPRYRAYQDSLSLYNQSVDLKEKLKPYFNTDAIKNKDKVLDILDDSQVYRNYDKTKNKPAISPINVSWSTGKPLLVNASGRMANNSNMSMASYPIYTKPQQQVIVERPNLQAIQNNLQSEGLIKSNTEFNADMSGLRPQVRQPKYYDIQENINQPFGGSQTNYRTSDLNSITSPDDLGPGNTRKIIPYYQTGGKLKFLQPTSDRLPEGYRIPYDTPSTERAMSIGGEDGEPAYLIPSFKYGKPLADPIAEFKKTGEHLGGPFKTWQEADEWENTVRHPAVENRETIMFPQEKFQTGGSLPGSVGFTYARTKGIPSNGPYAKKTLASAQNGVDMYNNPILAEENYIKGKGRSNYNPHTNISNLYDLDPRYNNTRAHENYHARQFAEGRSNFDIGHNTENALWAAMQKKPEITSTEEVFDNYHNRKRIEMEMDRPAMVNIVPETRFMPARLIDKYTDRNGLQYRNPNSMEGEAEYYGDLGEEYYKIPKGQNGMEMKYYQNGLDFKPKSISRDGAWLDQYDVAQNGKKKFKLKDERLQAIRPSESTFVKKPNFEAEQAKVQRTYVDQVGKQMAEEKRRKKLTKEQREREDYNARNEQTGSIQSPVEESTFDRTKAIVSNPLTAFGYAARNESLPTRFQFGERNTLDNAIDWINPLQGAAALSEIPGELGRGEYLNAGLSALDAADLGVYAKGAMKASKPFLQKGVQQLGNVRTSIAPELKYGLRTAGPSFNDLPKNMEPSFSRIGDSQAGTYTPFEEDEYIKWFNEQKSKMNPSVVKQDPRSILRKSSIININDMRQGGIIKDDRGQWKYPGQITEIGSNQITMQGVPYDVLGISDEGDTKLMKPGKNYKFKGKKVTEFPMAKNGRRQEQKGLQNLEDLTNFTNYNKPSNWLNKYN